MPKKLPFLEDGSQYGVSRTAFRLMRKAEKRERMIQWFHENFEDPSNSTPRDDGEFIWIWGGPYDARDELYSKFDGVASEALLEEVAEEVEREGITDWAPVHTENVEDWEDIDWSDELEELSSLDNFSDQRNKGYGSPADLEARKQVRAALDYLQNIPDRRRPIGIGHNRPPTDEPADVREMRERVRDAVEHLKAEFGEKSPAIRSVRRWTRPLRDALVSTGSWFGRKLDIAVDTAIKAAVKTTVVGGLGLLGLEYHEAL